MSRALRLSLPLALVLAGPALAADVTPERATAAEAAIRSFMQQTFGPEARVGDRPVRLVPDGEAYDATVTLAPGQVVTARVREGSAGIWTFDTLRYPNPAQFTIDIPSVEPNRPPDHVTYSVKAAEQDGAGRLDTTLATPSTSTASLRALDLTVTGEKRTSSTHVGRGTGASTMRPGSLPGTVDLLTSSTISDYSLVATTQTPQFVLDLRLDADTVESKLETYGVDRSKGVSMVSQLVTLVSKDASAPGGPTRPGTLPADPTAVKAFIASLDGIASRVVLDQVGVKLKGVVNGFAFSIDRVRVEEDGQSQDGKLGLGLQVELNGLVLPAIAGTPFASFIPSKTLLRVGFSGVDTKAILASLQVATDPARPQDAGPPPEFMGAVMAPGVTTAIDQLQVVIGASVLTAEGKVGVSTPGQLAGGGRVVATNFDALIDSVKTLPQAAQALPVMLFAKGIGRTDGNNLVWVITYDGTKVLVNGVDILAMAGGGGGRPSAPNRR